MQLTTDGISLDTGSSHFINAITALSDTGIFQQTGSVFSANEDFEITGSLTIDWNSTGKPLTITSGSLEVFSVSNNGIINLISQSSTPSATEGSLYFGNDKNLYLGV